jgi:hypothetical protein
MPTLCIDLSYGVVVFCRHAEKKMVSFKHSWDMPNKMALHNSRAWIDHYGSCRAVSESGIADVVLVGGDEDLHIGGELDDVDGFKVGVGAAQDGEDIFRQVVGVAASESSAARTAW